MSSVTIDSCVGKLTSRLRGGLVKIMRCSRRCASFTELIHLKNTQMPLMTRPAPGAQREPGVNVGQGGNQNS